MSGSDLITKCDECGAAIRISNLSLAGKTIKCPKCDEPVVLPRLDDDDELVPISLRQVAVVDDDEDAPRPRKRSRKRDQDDDDDDTPRPRKRKARRDEQDSERGNSKVWLFVGIGAAVLILAGVGIFLATQNKTPEVAKPNEQQPVPVNPWVNRPDTGTPKPVVEPPKEEKIPE